VVLRLALAHCTTFGQCISVSVRLTAGPSLMLTALRCPHGLSTIIIIIIITRWTSK
jgi:hypothetical protein